MPSCSKCSPQHRDNVDPAAKEYHVTSHHKRTLTSRKLKILFNIYFIKLFWLDQDMNNELYNVLTKLDIPIETKPLSEKLKQDLDLDIDNN